MSDWTLWVLVWNAALLWSAFQLWRMLRDAQTWPLAMYDRYSAPISYWTAIGFSVFAVAFLLMTDIPLVWTALLKL